MLIGSDILMAHVKESDWLKPFAEKILRAAESGKIKLYASNESLHELYYVSVKLGVGLESLLSKLASLTQIENIEWLPSTMEVSLTAITLMLEYDISSIFDAYYAATALLLDPDKTIISTDPVYDKLPGIRRIDPRDLAENLDT